jgi:hypothetical protein
VKRPQAAGLGLADFSELALAAVSPPLDDELASPDPLPPLSLGEAALAGAALSGVSVLAVLFLLA